MLLQQEKTVKGHVVLTAQSMSMYKDGEKKRTTVFPTVPLYSQSIVEFKKKKTFTFCYTTYDCWFYSLSTLYHPLALVMYPQ